MSEFLPEKLRETGAAPLRMAGRLAIRFIPFESALRLNRYNLHVRQLARELGNIDTHHAEHHVLRRFVADLPRQLLRPFKEEGQVLVLDTLPMQGNVRHDSVERITRQLTTLRSSRNPNLGVDDRELVDLAYHASTFRIKGRTDDIYERCKCYSALRSPKTCSSQ